MRSIRLSTVLSIALVLYPVLSMYGTVSVSIGDVMLLGVAVLCDLRIDRHTKRNFVPNRIHIAFLAYCAIVIVFRFILGHFVMASAVRNRFIKYGFFVYVIYVSRSIIDVQELYRHYRKLVICALAVLIVQYILYYGAHIVFVPKIPFLPYTGIISTEVQTRSLSFSFRPGAFLGEPGACSYVILPFLCYALFRKDAGVNKKDVALATIAILLTCSSAGLICVGIIYSYLYLKILFTKEISYFQKAKRVIALCAILIVAFLIFQETPLSQSMLRLIPNEATGETGVAWGKTSAGQSMLETQSELERIFGEGFGNIDMSSLSNYSNGVNYLLYCTGYLGMAIMLLWAVCVFLCTDHAGKVEVLLFCALCISCRIIISSNMMYFNIFAMLDDKIPLNAENLDNGEERRI